MRSQCLWIMVCYAEPVVVNHGLLYEASGCELLCYAVPVGVNHDV